MDDPSRRSGEPKVRSYLLTLRVRVRVLRLGLGFLGLDELKCMCVMLSESGEHEFNM